MDFLAERQFNLLFPDDISCINYLNANNVFYQTIQCPSCNQKMKKNIQKFVFRCPSFKCNRREFSIRKNTFFHQSKLKCLEIMRIARLWLSEVPRNSASKLSGISRKTISTFYGHFRQLVSSALTPEDQIIGGEDIIVEIDETKLGKRKYYKGHRVDGVWVVCGIERTDNKNVFCIPVENRSAETLEKIIETHVRPGSIIYTDLWKGYTNIENNLHFKHGTVNHSKYFKDPISGVCTNTVEGLNYALKLKIFPRNRCKKGIENRLDELIWRKINKNNICGAFIKALADIHYE